MRMDNGDEYLTALQEFANADEKQLTPELVDVLEVVAKTGKCLYHWEILKPFFVYTLDEVTKDFLNSSDVKDDDHSLESTRSGLVESFQEFTSAPFTLQRLAELLADPKKHYKSPAKYFRGLQKNILVVSTIDVESASVKSLKRQRDQIAEHKQNGSVTLCSPRKVRRIDSQGQPVATNQSADAMAVDESDSNTNGTMSNNISNDNDIDTVLNDNKLEGDKVVDDQQAESLSNAAKAPTNESDANDSTPPLLPSIGLLASDNHNSEAAMDES